MYVYPRQPTAKLFVLLTFVSSLTYFCSFPKLKNNTPTKNLHATTSFGPALCFLQLLVNSIKKIPFFCSFSLSKSKIEKKILYTWWPSKLFVNNKKVNPAKGCIDRKTFVLPVLCDALCHFCSRIKLTVKRPKKQKEGKKGELQRKYVENLREKKRAPQRLKVYGGENKTMEILQKHWGGMSWRLRKRNEEK